MNYLKTFENYYKQTKTQIDQNDIETTDDYDEISQGINDEDDKSSNSYENEFEQKPTNENIKALDKQGLRQWMEHYHDLWLKNHHKTIQIEKVLEKDISDKEKLNEIQSLINELRASYSFFK